MENKTVQLTNEERARVFHCYMPNVQILVNKRIATITSINRQGILCCGMPWSFKDAKLLLTPLSEISDEHAIEVAKLFWPTETEYQTVEKGKEIINSILGYRELAWIVFQYLILQGYAIPLFLGIDHPANGKNAIELELAFDKTKLQING